MHYNLKKTAKSTFHNYLTDKHNSEGETRFTWSLQRVEFLRYYYMKIGDKYIIRLLDSPQYIIPLNNKLLTNIETSKKAEYIKSEPFTRKDSLILANSLLLWQKQDFKAIKTSNGYELNNRFGNNVLLQPYDTIQMNGQLIIAEKDNKITIYNTLLDTITVNNLQAAQFYYWGAEAIADNKHIWINHSGQTNKLQRPIPQADIFPNYLHYTDYRFEINNNTLTLNISQEKQYTTFDGSYMDKKSFIIKNTDIDSIYFSGYKEYWMGEPYWCGNCDYDNYQLFLSDYLIIKRDNKYGFSLPSIDMNERFDLISKTPVIFDKVEPYEDGWGTVFYKGDLMGIYPYNTEAHYTQIDKKKIGDFIRFTLPSGHKGWLNTRDGKEYFDIEK